MLRHLVALGLGVIFLVLSAPRANAWIDPGRYRIIDLWEIGFAPNPDAIETGGANGTKGTMGLNNHGEVVYGMKVIVNNEPHTHACVYLPSPRFGFSEAGVIDLHVEGGITEDDSIARDINENGFIIGQVGAIADGAGRACMWWLAEGEVRKTILDTLEDGTWSSGHAINNDDPPLVVGVADKMVGITICPCDGAAGVGQAHIRRAFSARPSSSNTLTDLSASAMIDTYARDVMTKAQSTDPLKSVGYSHCPRTYTFTPQCTPQPLSGCAHEITAVQWSDTSGHGLHDLDADTSSRAYGTNNSGQIVGFGNTIIDPQGNAHCEQDAVIWSDGNINTIPVAISPSGDDHDTVAYAISNNTLRKVVGRDVTLGKAMIWEQDSEGEWHGIILDTLSYPGNYTTGCGVRWSIVQAHDINDNDQLAVVGFDGSSYRAFLLVPFSSPAPPTDPDCRADINGDGRINHDDLIELMTARGMCVPFTDCPADLDCDHDVDFDDLVKLYTCWQNLECCPGVTHGTMPTSVADCFDKFADNPDSLFKCLNAISEINP